MAKAALEEKTLKEKAVVNQFRSLVKKKTNRE